MVGVATIRMLALATLLASCGQVLGLEHPELVAADAMVDGVTVGDRDGDGVADAQDNCPDDPNPDQTDVDKDLVGDRCQGCVTLPLRAADDDDQDTLNDTVDNCIGITAAQSDADGDGIGNACDPRQGTDVRFCVWTFRDPATGEDQMTWTRSWQLANARIESSSLIFEPMQVLASAELRDASFDGPGGVAFATRTRVSQYNAPARVGVVARAQPNLSYTCQTVQSATNVGSVQILRNSMVERQFDFAIPFPVSIVADTRMVFVREPSKVTLRCLVDAQGLPSVNLTYELPDTVTTLGLGLFAERANLEVESVTVYELGM